MGRCCGEGWDLTKILGAAIGRGPPPTRPNMNARGYVQRRSDHTDERAIEHE